MFAVCLLSNDQYIGNARLSSIDWENKRAAYGRLIGVTNLHGKGIGTEVLALLAYYAFNILKLNRIQTGVLSNNIASLKSNDKVGAVREGISRQFTYLDGTVHEFRHRGNGARQFYNSTSNSWSRYYGLGDHSASVRTHTGNTSKNYLIECTVIVGVSTWTFRALDGGVSEVELKDESEWSGLLQVEVKDIPIFDISTGYLLLNDGSFVQNYRVFDAAGNFSDISRSISVERLQPFINLNYTQDFNRNIFLKTYHQQFTAFIDPLGWAYDYYLGELTGNAIQTVQALPEYDLGIHTVKYKLENYSSTRAERQVHVVDIKCLSITTDGLNNLKTEGINYKYGLYNDTYVINITDSSNAIRVFGYNYDYSYK